MSVPPQSESSTLDGKLQKCSFGKLTDSPCKHDARFVSTFNGKDINLFWCSDHLPPSDLPFHDVRRLTIQDEKENE